MHQRGAVMQQLLWEHGQIRSPARGQPTPLAMNTRVITVESQLGSNGEQIARLVADALDFRCLDEEIIDRAAREGGVPPKAIADAEHTQSRLARALAAFASNPGSALGAWCLGASPVVNPAYTADRYRKLIDEVLRSLAKDGNAIVIGHAGHMSLRKRWDTLRVLTVASDSRRILRIQDAFSATKEHAAEIARRADAERKEYFARTYGEHWLSPTLYDLCINTDHSTAVEAAHLICEAARRR